MIAEVDFNSSSDHHYEEFPTVTFTNMQSLNGDYSNHYQYVVVPTYSTNYIDSFKVKMPEIDGGATSIPRPYFNVRVKPYS